MNHFLRLFCVYFLFCGDHAYGSLGIWEGDLELSRKIPLISGASKEDILEKDKAVLTLCTTPLKYVRHVSLVFEMKHSLKNEINLFAVHFGGDGDSDIIDKTLPTIDTASEVIRKVFRGKKTTISQAISSVPPIYTREVCFIVDRDKALNAIQKVEGDVDLEYRLKGSPYFYGKNSYNCCTYVDKVLKDAGIDTGFTQSWGNLKRTTTLLGYCSDYLKKHEEKHKIKEYDTYYKNIEEYRDSVDKFFNKGQSYFKDPEYDKAWKYFLEAENRGHPKANSSILEINSLLEKKKKRNIHYSNYFEDYSFYPPTGCFPF